MKRFFRWRVASVGLVIAGAAFGTTIAGCGGGNNGGSSTVDGTAPTDATRARVQSLYSQSIQSVSNAGVQTLTMAQERFSGAPSPEGSDAATGAGAGIVISSGGMTPYIGAFLRQNAIRGTASATGGVTSRQTDSDGSSGTDPSGVGSGFYYDYYLGLWVEMSETPQKSTYTLYEDEAKQKPAGFITTEYPADWETFPQVYRSSYEFTAGYIAGAHGFYNTTTGADYSGTSDYENVYEDGGKSTGTSRWSSRGDSTYQGREELADGSWSESVGTFRSNGSGGTRFTTSDGSGAEYTFNANGSGRGKITGKEPGLPATIVWDARGNTTITYADGTVERHSYEFGYGTGYYGGDIATTSAPAPVEEPDVTKSTRSKATR